MTTTREAGRKGAEARNAKYDHEERSQISKRAAETRKEREGQDVFREMGREGGKNSHSTTSKNRRSTNKN